MPYAGPLRHFSRRKHARARKAVARHQSKKRLVRLIKSVALRDVETKRLHVSFQLFSTLFPPGGSQYTALIPLFYDIPFIKNSLTNTSVSMIGEEIHSKGVAFRFYIGQTDSAASIASATRVRITLLSTNHIEDVTTVGGQLVLGTVPGTWYDTPHVGGIAPVTIAKWNTQRVKVLKTKLMQIRPNGGSNFLMVKNFFAGVKGKKRKLANESSTVNDYMGFLSGKDYVVAVEVYNQLGEDVSLNTTIGVSKITYFKDA